MALVTVHATTGSRCSCGLGQHKGEGGEDKGERYGAHCVVGTGELRAVVRAVVMEDSEALANEAFLYANRQGSDGERKWLCKTPTAQRDDDIFYIIQVVSPGSYRWP
jgi:hypothetical protein